MLLTTAINIPRTVQAALLDVVGQADFEDKLVENARGQGYYGELSLDDVTTLATTGDYDRHGLEIKVGGRYLRIVVEELDS